MKLQNNNGQYRLTLPKSLVDMKGWDQGSKLVIIMNSEGDLVIKEVQTKKKK